MDWPNIQSAIRNAIAAAVPVSFSSYWEGYDTAGTWGMDSISLRLVGVDRLGQDEIRYRSAIQSADLQTRSEEDLQTRAGETLQGNVSLAGQVLPQIFGNRRLRVEAKIETDRFTALDFADRIMTRLGACPETQSALAAACLSTSKARILTNASYCDCDGRRVSASVIELVFNSTTALDCALIDTIAKATVTGDVLYPTGGVARAFEIVAETPA